jgi:hypothetical protein
LCQSDCTCDLSGSGCCESLSAPTGCANNVPASNCYTLFNPDGARPVGGGATCHDNGSCGPPPETPGFCCSDGTSCYMGLLIDCGGGQPFAYATCDPSGACIDQRPPCESTVGGFCWFRGAAGDDCDTTCANQYRYYDDATALYAGSAGTGANCSALATDFGKSGAIDTACATGVGCYDSGLPAFFRCTSPPTTSAATQAGFERICACQDAPSACTGELVGGFCWYLGAAGASCDTTCANQGLACDPATISYAGTGGTLAQCDAVLDALAGPGTTYALSDTASGCLRYLGSTAFHDTGFPTTCAEVPSGTIERACACY